MFKVVTILMLLLGAITVPAQSDSVISGPDRLRIAQLRAEKRFEEALAALEDLTERNPERIELLLLRADINKDLVRPKVVAETMLRIKAILDKTVGSGSGNWEPYADRALYNLRAWPFQLSPSKNQEQAVSDIQSAVVRVGSSRQGLQKVAPLLVLIGKFELARSLLDTAISLYPDDETFYLRRMEVNKSLGNFEGALWDSIEYERRANKGILHDFTSLKILSEHRFSNEILLKAYGELGKVATSRRAEVYKRYPNSDPSWQFSAIRLLDLKILEFNVMTVSIRDRLGDQKAIDRFFEKNLNLEVPVSIGEYYRLRSLYFEKRGQILDAIRDARIGDTPLRVGDLLMKVKYFEAAAFEYERAMTLASCACAAEASRKLTDARKRFSDQP